MDARPRKLPRQARSKATVEAIVEATAQILVEEGYDRFTTARVAIRAGVSVGSLYQYFPNKAALAAAVVERSCEEFLATFEQMLAAERRNSLRGTIKAIVGKSVVSHHLAPDLHRIVNELADRIGLGERTRMVSREIAGMLENLLRDHSDEILPDVDIPVGAKVIETLLEALAHRATLPPCADAPNRAVGDEAVLMISRYLCGGG